MAKAVQAKRQPMITIATGQTGVGKTFRSVREMLGYIKGGRKVLIFDVNEEADYRQFKTVDFDLEAESEAKATKGVRLYSMQAKAEGRRVRPLLKDGQPMSLDHKAKACFILLRNFKGGLMVLEDINNYLTSSRNKDFISSLCTNRHRAQDILIHLQSLRAIDTRLWQNLTYIRMHYQVEAIDKYEQIFPNFELMKIAQNIINAQYMQGNIRFFLYVNVRENKLEGCDIRAFRKGCKDFLSRYKGVLNVILEEEDEHGRKRFKTRKDAIEHYISQKMYYLNKAVPPFCEMEIPADWN
jgi:hypothetical protein